ncbi:SRPBCC family protein [Olivibacter domesticus]|uniref:Uncharacterized conserved protein YndB, AHSA1/START domain n=1 Tax=Olivibacter domesticus TaxID=407022 RepID=A0A1H7W2T0_OLID1|nr:SRPBCC domain-containing protein [Olivibacter domesticus]SEM15375.1 Uncharacterized conserved protein YndB, AHSA1/START domain [Olivibacter domesticus]
MDEKNLLQRMVNKTVIINASSSKVWEFLTDIKLMKKWMFETEIDIITDWKVGSPITIRVDWYKTQLENKGIILAFKPNKHLKYSHLSSLSRLPNTIENYSIIDFSLTEEENQTALTITLSNFPTETIYKHLAFYWNITLELLKKLIEQ